MLSVGIDISSNKITVVELLSARKGTVIKNAASFEIPEESIKKGELQDPAALSMGLRQAWKKYRISGRNVFIGLSNLKAIIKEVELPLVAEEEINNSLKYQINDFIPIPKDNILYDYYILEKTKNSSRIMLVGAMKSMILNVIKAVKGAGLIARAIDLNCFSLFRTIEQIYDLSNHKKAFCAVNIGPEISIIEIIKNDTLKFPRLLSNSSSTFISNIERITGTDKQLSRDILYNYDFKNLIEKSDGEKKLKQESRSIQDKDDKKKTELKKADINEKPDNKKTEQQPSSIKLKELLKDDNIKKTIITTADNIINEIKMSIEHYLQENSKSKIEKIVLAGENLKNIEKYIQYKTNYKVEKLNISKKFSINLINKNTIYKDTDINQILNPLAIGMALRGIR